MKIKLLIALAILIGLILISESFGGENNPDAVIIYTGNMQGNIIPEGCCNKVGGVAKRLTKISDLKNAYADAILLDSGNYFGFRSEEKWLKQLKAEFMVKAFKMLPYDAINIASLEVQAVGIFLKTFASSSNLSLISSNLKGIRDLNRDLKPYIIKNLGKYRFAVFGIALNRYLQKDQAGNFNFIDTAESIKKYLPEIKQQVDYIILLSDAQIKDLKILLNEIPDIDIAVAGEGPYSDFEPEIYNRTIILKNIAGGGTVGTAKIWFDGSGKISNIQGELILLDKEITPADRYKKLETEFNKEKRAMKDPAKRFELEIKKAKEYLKLSPEEFLNEWNRKRI